MDQSPKILLQEDLRAFMGIVKNHNPEVRVNSLVTFDDIMTCEFLRQGIYNDASEAPGLMRLYNEFFLPAPVARRREVYDHVKRIVSSIGGWTVNAFTPFMLLDDDIGVVSTATIDYASLGTLIENDPISRPKDVINMIAEGIPKNPAAVIGGLLALGDPRVCDLVSPLRKMLDASQTEIVAKCFSGYTAKCVVDFYLDWLEELVDRLDDEGLGLFGHVTAGLCRLADRQAAPFMNDGLRPFPVPSEESGTDWSSVTIIDPDEFASSIADRLYDLERREGAHKVMPHAIRAFGLKPKTPAADTANFH